MNFINTLKKADPLAMAQKIGGDITSKTYDVVKDKVKGKKEMEVENEDEGGMNDLLMEINKANKESSENRVYLKIVASQAVKSAHKIDYLKYKLYYTKDKFYEGYFDVKKGEEEFSHTLVVKKTEDASEMLKNISAQKLILSLKQKKKLFGKDVLGKQAITLNQLTLRQAHE
jgi:hypothetical protein